MRSPDIMERIAALGFGTVGEHPRGIRQTGLAQEQEPGLRGCEAGGGEGLGTMTDSYSEKLRLFAPALEAMRITTSSVLTVSSSGAFLRRPHRLWGHTN